MYIKWGNCHPELVVVPCSISYLSVSWGDFWWLSLVEYVMSLEVLGRECCWVHTPLTWPYNLFLPWQVDTRVTACPWWWTSWREYSAGRCLDPTSGSGRALHGWLIWYADKSKTFFIYLYTPCSTETSKNSFAQKNFAVIIFSPLKIMVAINVK